MTGIRAIDGLLTCGRGQRIGIFAGSGVGKNALLGCIARHSTADVNVIGRSEAWPGSAVSSWSATCAKEGLRRSVSGEWRLRTNRLFSACAAPRCYNICRSISGIRAWCGSDDGFADPLCLGAARD